MSEKKDALEKILSGERISCKIKTKRGVFVINYPLPRDLRRIEVNVAKMLDGMSESSFSKQQVASFRAYATLDEVILESPEWWNNLESAEDCPDDDLITKLYVRYLRLYKKVQESIARSGFDGSSGIGKSKNEDEIVAD